MSKPSPAVQRKCSFSPLSRHPRPENKKKKKGPKKNFPKLVSSHCFLLLGPHVSPFPIFPRAYNFECASTAFKPHSEQFRCSSRFELDDDAESTHTVTVTDFRVNTVQQSVRTVASGLHLFALAVLYTPPASVSVSLFFFFLFLFFCFLFSIPPFSFAKL